MRNNSLRIHPSALGGYTIEGPYKRKPVRRTMRARVALLLAVLVAGCSHASADSSPFEYLWRHDAVQAVHDRETGCWYVVFSGRITPRLNASGNPMCGGV